MSQTSVPLTMLYIGQKGYFSFHSPFDVAYHLDNESLVVDHMSTIGDLLYDKVDIYLQYFATYKLSKTQYTAFLNANGVIVTFKAKDGTRYGIPSTFIKAIPNKTDIPYRQMGLNIVFGMLPINYSIGALSEQLSKAILYNTGVNATINIVPLSPEILMPVSYSLQMDSARLSNVSYYDPIHQLEQQIELLSSIIPCLSACILDPDNCSLIVSLSGNTSLPQYELPGAGSAIFGGGESNYDSTDITSVYNYAANSSLAGSNLTYRGSNLAAAGNSIVGVFGSGSSYGSYVSSTSLYTYSTNLATQGTNLSALGVGLAAAGNSIIGIFGLGYTLNDTDYNYNYSSAISIYTYSSNIVSAGTNLTFNAENSAAAGNETEAVFAGGYYNQYLNTSSIYSYLTNIAVAGVNLTYLSEELAACGNSTLGVFGGGYTDNNGDYYELSSVTSIYTYVSNVTQTGGSLTYSFNRGAAAGDSVIGVFGGGYGVANSISVYGSGSSYEDYTEISTTSIYIYSSNSSMAGANLTYSSFSLAAVSNNNAGVIQ